MNETLLVFVGASAMIGAALAVVLLVARSCGQTLDRRGWARLGGLLGCGSSSPPSWRCYPGPAAIAIGVIATIAGLTVRIYRRSSGRPPGAR